MISSAKERGFTLIELVIVIVLIGILAATALPKFADLSGKARTAAAQGIAGSLRSAASILRANWIANGSVAGGSINVDNTTIHMSSQGWPEGTSAASNGVMTNAKCDEVLQGIMDGAPPSCTTAAASGCEIYSRVSSGSTSVCEFLDQGGATSSKNTITYNITNGSISVVTS